MANRPYRFSGCPEVGNHALYVFIGSQIEPRPMATWHKNTVEIFFTHFRRLTGRIQSFQRIAHSHEFVRLRIAPRITATRFRNVAVFQPIS